MRCGSHAVRVALRRGAASLVLLTLSACQSVPDCRALPDGFVYLRRVEPTILQDMRYAGERNFVGAVVDGYEAPECVLTEGAARALADVQAELRTQGYGLMVFDCTRPARAVAHFMRWAEDDDTSTRSTYYPALAKRDLIEQGYIATRSQHSLGSAVDLTLVDLRPGGRAADTPPAEENREGDGFCGARPSTGASRREVNMGTGFDCFDERSHTLNPDVAPAARRNRLILKEAMEKHGFLNYASEWWHYNYRHPEKDPVPQDFPITAPGTCRGE